MSILSFDEKELRRQLERLPNGLGVAFAAACAQRQVPNYARFSKVAGQGEPSSLIQALSCLWDELQGKLAAKTQLQQQLDVCMSLLPDPEGDHLDRLAYYAEDAVSSAAYAIQARLEANIQHAIWAAERAYNALDEFVGAQNHSGPFDQKEESRILSHPLVQAELGRQQADLAQLQKIAAGSMNESEGIAQVLHRAQTDANIFFGGRSE
jgi:uncharacterized protein YjaG (DUF416 family)